MEQIEYEFKQIYNVPTYATTVYMHIKYMLMSSS
jgi:hypothetical protein